LLSIQKYTKESEMQCLDPGRCITPERLGHRCSTLGHRCSTLGHRCSTLATLETQSQADV